MEWFDYDEFTGATTYFDHDEIDDKTTLYTVQNVQGLLDRNKSIANQGLADQGIKENWWHYCDIPLTVELELRKKGIDISNPDHGKKMFEIINRDYPYLKLTTKKHVSR